MEVRRKPRTKRKNTIVKCKEVQYEIKKNITIYKTFFKEVHTMIRDANTKMKIQIP